MVYKEVTLLTRQPMQSELVEKYFNNQCSVEEAELVLKWFDTDEGQQYLKQRLDDDLAHRELSESEAAFDSEALLARLQQKINRRTAFSNAHSVYWTWARWVAAAMVVVAGGYWYQFMKEEIVQTAYGETRTVKLADSTLIILNGNSKLRFKKQWHSFQKREVWIEGEAFFQVAHTPNHQHFLVHLPNKVNVEVLGTEFDVYARKTKTRVVLNTGKIQLTHSEQDHNPLVMKPGDLYESNAYDTKLVTRRVNSEVYSSWRNARLTFDKMSLADIAQQLEDTYGLEVVIEDKTLLRQEFSGTIPTQNIDILLEALGRLFDLKIIKNQDKVIIQSNQ